MSIFDLRERHQDKVRGSKGVTLKRGGLALISCQIQSVGASPERDHLNPGTPQFR